MNFYHKAISLAGFVLLTVLPAQAQVRQTREEYINKYKKIAVAHMERYGIPASITMAQGILESDCGNSWLSQASNNHFGIKCKRNWTGDVVYYDDDEKGECFRSYPSVEASYQDHAEFLDSQPRYDSLFSYAPNDLKSWARGLKAAGYATALDYAQRLIRIIEESKLYLLDREDGLTINGAQTGHLTDDWFSGQSNVDQAAAIASGAVDPDDYRVTVNAHKGYNVYRTNGVNYIVAKEGDTFESLAEIFCISARNLRKFNDLKGKAQPVRGERNYILAHDGDTFEKISRDFRISARNLRKFNDVGKNAQPVANEVIYIGRKKKRWDGNVLLHTVREGETLWSLGQSYGIRTKSLARLNKLKEGDALTPGTTIKIR